LRNAAGLAELEQKAAVYRTTARKFVHDGLVVNRAFIDPKTRDVKAYLDGLGDSGIYTGPYLASIAYEYGATGSAESLAHLKEVLTGVYNLMTLAGRSDGVIVDRATGQRMAPRPGLAIRGFGN